MGYYVDVELIESLKDACISKGLIFNLLSVLHSIIEMF